ncbi:MAG: DNA recombination protein RmuC [Ginsengibacter sp.]
MFISVALVIVILLLLVNLFILIKSKANIGQGYKFDSLHADIQRIESAVKNEIASNRKEAFDNAANARSEQASTLDGFKKDFLKTIKEFNELQKDNFYALLNKQGEQNTNTGSRLDNMRQTIERKIGELQQGNENKLEQMRQTVDEKLQKTLEARLGESFKVVSERLESVHKGLGDMQQLATGVGDLKRVLNNVKTRGVMGEYQLHNLLEDILTPEQYGKNIKTKQGSSALVEFAVKLPGNKGSDTNFIWLPVDSKFPREAFELLNVAYDNGNPQLIEEHRRTFAKGIKLCAMDICAKYIDPPNTTDFAILFLPFESIYAEVLRTPGLFETVRKDCNIVITGPGNLSAFLSSLQMGFRTLAIEKRSSEVWQLLSAVKTEFGNFHALLQKAQHNIQTGLNQLDDVAGKRSRAIEKRLKGIDTLSDDEVKTILPELSNIDGFEEEQ